MGEQLGFEDLECYQLATQVLKEAYALAGRLPAVERHNLADQMRRAATSAVLSIAEGYGRYHYLDRLRFFYIARGSLMETLGAFTCCEAVGYLAPTEMSRIRGLVHQGLRSLNGYIRHVRNQQQGKTEFGTHLVREPEAPFFFTGDDLET